MSMKNSNETNGNRTRDLPVCSAMPQQTVPPHTPHNKAFHYFCVSRNIVGNQKKIDVLSGNVTHVS